MATAPAQGSLGFQSQLTDASTGQVDMLTRMYEPGLGRFSSRDALFGDASNPVSLNQFGYGSASPVTLSDPTGLYPVGYDGSGGDCGDACANPQQYGYNRGDPPSVNAPDPLPPASTQMPTVTVDWTQTRTAEGWSPSIVGEDFLTAFARFITGWSCELEGCAPINPGSIGVGVVAQLTYRSFMRSRPNGWQLSILVVADTRRLNPESGFELQSLELHIRGKGGAQLLGSYSKEYVTTADGPGYLYHVHVATGSPQPATIVASVTAGPSEGAAGPIEAVTQVYFDPMPTGPLPPQEIPPW